MRTQPPLNGTKCLFTCSVLCEDEVEYPVGYELWLVGVAASPLLPLLPLLGVESHQLSLTLVELLPIILEKENNKSKSSSHTFKV